MTVKEFEAHCLHTLDSCAGLVRRVPPDKLDWRPLDNVMTMGQLLAHLATGLTDVVAMAVDPSKLPSQELMEQMMDSANWPSMTVDEALATIEHQKAKLGEVLAGITDQAWLTEQRSLPWGVSGSLGLCAFQGLEHAIAHRHQLFYYLKLLGQPLSTMELYGMA